MATTEAMDMEQKAFLAIERYGLIQAGDNVIAALSGGADSVALFHFLAVHRHRLGIGLRAAHLEHGLRGKASLRDAALAERLCAEHGVPLDVEHADMAQTPRPKGLGTEAWARRLRYAFFERLAAAHGAKIATAHTQGDNAETVLFNAIRGTGPRGLGGIPPQRGSVIRPLLLATRADTEAYCKANGLAWAEDATNADPVYSRNRLRHVVMPELERAHPGAAAALARMADDMRALDGWLDGQAKALLCRAAQAGNPAWGGWDAAVLRKAPRPVLLQALGGLARGPDTDRAGLERALGVLDGGVRAVQLPGGLYAALCKGRFFLERPLPPADAEIPLAEGRMPLWGGYLLEAGMVPLDGCGAETEKKLEKLTKKGLTFAADYDKINECGVLRPRKPQDTFAPAGRGVTKPLRRWMTEAGIPPWRRLVLPVLAAGSRVLWVWGAGFCEGLQPGPGTRRLLVLRQIKDGSVDARGPEEDT